MCQYICIYSVCIQIEFNDLVLCGENSTVYSYKVNHEEDDVDNVSNV